MSHATPRPAGALPANVYSAALRQAGVRVTSARIATLRLAPAVLAEHGQLNPRLLHAAALALGHTHVSMSAFYNTLPTLAAAGLLPAAVLAPARRAGNKPPFSSPDTGYDP